MQSSKHTKCDIFVRQQFAFNGRIRCLLCLGCFEGCGTSSPCRISPKNSPKQVPTLLIWSHLILCVALQAWVTGSSLFSLLTKPRSLLQQPYAADPYHFTSNLICADFLIFCCRYWWLGLPSAVFFTALKAAAPAQPAIDLSNLQVLSQLAKHFILRPPGAHWGAT